MSKPEGIFSVGEQTFKDIYNYADNHSYDMHNALETNYALQSRLGNYWKNNPAQVLEFSKKFSGQTNNNNVNPSPLGGPINYNAANITNRQDSKFFSDEFNFWDLNSDKHKNSNLAVPNENFENTNFENKNENFENKNFEIENFQIENLENNKSSHSKTESNISIIIPCSCIILFFLIIIVLYCFPSKMNSLNDIQQTQL